MKPINLENLLARARQQREARLAEMKLVNPNMAELIEKQNIKASPPKAVPLITETETDFGTVQINSKEIENVVYQQLYTSTSSETVYSEEQEGAIQAALRGESFCLVGKAGTGKTTTVKEIVRRLQQAHRIAPLGTIEGHKHLKSGSLGAVCLAFTNRAINNISKSFDLATTAINFMTIHKLLEYTKEEFTYVDKETGESKTSFRFVPSRTVYNKLPSGLQIQIIEEASMVSKEDLHQKLVDASHAHVQFIYLGDLQQLPPIYGDGVLGYKLNELPTYELTKIYRQAAENPIIKLAWDISNGRKLTKEILTREYAPVKDLTAPIQITFWDKKLDWESANITMGKFFCGLIDRQIFNWESDIILIPYGKQFGTIELNKRIAQHLSNAREAPTYEIIAGFNKHYYAVGDKVLFNKKEGVIRKITKNGRYIGKSPMPASQELQRDGSYVAKDGKVIQHETEDHMSSEDVDRYLLAMQHTKSLEDEDETQNQASHNLEIELLSEQMEDGSNQATVSTRGEYGKLELAYAITIHKAQGSEWRKVFLILHNSHTHINRELLYTAVTRASQQLFIVCEPDSFTKGVVRQRIKGDTLQEKIAWFKMKIEEKMQLKGKSQTQPTESEEDNES